MAGRVRIFFDTNALKKELNKWRVRKIKSLTKNTNLYKDLARLYAEKIDPYTPYKTGKLSKYRVYGSKDGILYDPVDKRGRHYGAYQYNADDSGWNRTRYPHPDARSQWAGPEVRKIIWKDFVKDARPIVADYIKRGEKGIR